MVWTEKNNNGSKHLIMYGPIGILLPVSWWIPGFSYFKQQDVAQKE